MLNKSVQGVPNEGSSTKSNLDVPELYCTLSGVLFISIDMVGCYKYSTMVSEALTS